jgi:hypothetical protein
MGVGQNGCTPETPEYKQILQQKQDAKMGDTIDEVLCRSYGEPGSTAYVECRRKRTEDRQLFEPPARVRN